MVKSELDRVWKKAVVNGETLKYWKELGLQTEIWTRDLQNTSPHYIEIYSSLGKLHFKNTCWLQGFSVYS